MTLKLTTTNAAINVGPKVLVYGRPDAGKTTLLLTVPNTLVISSEDLMSLRGHNLPLFKIGTVEEFLELIDILDDPNVFSNYGAVGVDSVTDISRMLLERMVKEQKDGRKAQYIVQDYVMTFLRKLRNINTPVVVLAWQQEYGGEVTPAATGKILTEALGHFFNEVFHLARWPAKDENQRDIVDPATGRPVERRFLQTRTANGIFARDNTNTLELFEPADLGTILAKLAATGA